MWQKKHIHVQFITIFCARTSPNQRISEIKCSAFHRCKCMQKKGKMISFFRWESSNSTPLRLTQDIVFQVVSWLGRRKKGKRKGLNMNELWFCQTLLKLKIHSPEIQLCRAKNDMRFFVFEKSKNRKFLDQKMCFWSNMYRSILKMLLIANVECNFWQNIIFDDYCCHFQNRPEYSLSWKLKLKCIYK